MIDKLDLNTKAQELRELFGEEANSPLDIFSLAGQIDGLTIVYYWQRRGCWYCHGKRTRRNLSQQ